MSYADVGISGSSSETIDPTLLGYTVFNFSSPWASGGTNDLTTRVSQSATASATAASGNASSTQAASLSGGGSDVSGTPGGGGIKKYWPWIAGGVGALGLMGFLWWKFRR